MANIWNPDDQWKLDPASGQYQQQAAPQLAPQGGINWADVEQQLRTAGGNLYDPTDLEGIQRNTGYSVGGVSLDQALQNQRGIYDQRRSSERTGSQAQSPQYATPTQQWNQQPAMQPQSDALFKLLMERAQQGTAVDRNSANVRSQVDPVVAQQQRASRNYIDTLAEKAGPLANIQGEQRLAAERGGQAAGALESEVIGRENDRLLQEKMQALQLGAQFMSEQERNQLQREIAYLQDAAHTADRTQNQGQFSASQSQANDQFLRELALREYDTTNKWDYAWSGV